MKLILSLFFCVIAAAPLAADSGIRIMAFGDSLSAGYRLKPEEGFAPVLEQALRDRGFDVTVKNSAVSGATTADGRSRLEYAMRWEPDIVILELGANDALRVFNPRVTRENLDWMLQAILQRDVDVLLAGMLAPRNLGERYGNEFNSIYPDLAQKHGVPLYPFFLDGVALVPELNLDDAVHPNPAGVERIVEGIAPYVIDLIGRQE